PETVAATMAGIWLNGMQNGTEHSKTNGVSTKVKGAAHENSNGRNGHNGHYTRPGKRSNDEN
ncbi:MAG TPA: hypothetical protein VGK01_23605, partial [Candidatus Angelobacter sp.]